LHEKSPAIGDELKAFLQNDRFATANAMHVAEVRPGFAVAEVDIDPARHHNSIDSVHGGVYFTLAALAFSAACNAAGQTTVGIEMSLSCLKAVVGGRMRAEAREVSRSRKLATVEVRITDDGGQLVGLFRGTAYIKRDPYPPILD
jgi:acyl-CoA thioesterase